MHVCDSTALNLPAPSRRPSTTGILKMTYPIAWTTSLLAWSVLSNAKAYGDANQTAETLNQLEWGASYLLKTIYNDSSSGTNIIYQARRRIMFHKCPAFQMSPQAC